MIFAVITILLFLKYKEEPSLSSYELNLLYKKMFLININEEKTKSWILPLFFQLFHLF